MAGPDMTDAALEVVFDHLHARRMRDLDALAKGLDPAVVHQGVLPSLVCHGRDAVMERVSSSLDGAASGIERLELIAAGDRALARIAGPRFREIARGRNPLDSGDIRADLPEFDPVERVFAMAASCGAKSHVPDFDIGHELQIVLAQGFGSFDDL